MKFSVHVEKKKVARVTARPIFEIEQPGKDRRLVLARVFGCYKQEAILVYIYFSTYACTVQLYGVVSAQIWEKSSLSKVFCLFFKRSFLVLTHRQAQKRLVLARDFPRACQAFEINFS